VSPEHLGPHEPATFLVYSGEEPIAHVTGLHPGGAYHFRALGINSLVCICVLQACVCVAGVCLCAFVCVCMWVCVVYVCACVHVWRVACVCAFVNPPLFVPMGTSHKYSCSKVVGLSCVWVCVFCVCVRSFT